MVNKQKQHFAKVRTRLQNGASASPHGSPFLPSFLENEKSLHVGSAPIENRIWKLGSNKSNRQRILEYEGVAPLARRPRSIRSRSRIQGSRTQTKGSPQNGHHHPYERPNHQEVSGGHGRGMPSSPPNIAESYSQTNHQRTQEQFLEDKSKESDERALEAKRRHLLQQPDWVGLGISRPAALSFTSHSSRKYVGKRRRVGRQIQHLWAAPPAWQYARKTSECMMSGALPVDDEHIRVRVGTGALLDSQSTPTAPIATIPAEVPPIQSQPSLADDTMLLETVVAAELQAERGNDSIAINAIVQPGRLDGQEYFAAGESRRIYPGPKHTRQGTSTGTDRISSPAITPPNSLKESAPYRDNSPNGLKHAGLAQRTNPETSVPDHGTLRFAERGGHVVSNVVTAAAATLQAPLVGSAAENVHESQQAQDDRSFDYAGFVEKNSRSSLDTALNAEFGRRLGWEREEDDRGPKENDDGAEESEGHRGSSPEMSSVKSLVVETTASGSGQGESSPLTRKRRCRGGQMGKPPATPDAALETGEVSSSVCPYQYDVTLDTQRVQSPRVRPLSSFRFSALPSARDRANTTQSTTDGGSMNKASEPESSVGLTQSPSRSLRDILRLAELPAVTGSPIRAGESGSTTDTGEAWTRFILGGESTSGSDDEVHSKHPRTGRRHAVMSSGDAAGASSLRVEVSKSSPAAPAGNKAVSVIHAAVSGNTASLLSLNNPASPEHKFDNQLFASELSSALASLVPGRPVGTSTENNPAWSVASAASNLSTAFGREATRWYGNEDVAGSAAPSTSRIAHPRTSSGMPPRSTTASASESGATAGSSRNSAIAELASPPTAHIVFSRPARFVGSSVAARYGTSTARAHSDVVSSGSTGVDTAGAASAGLTAEEAEDHQNNIGPAVDVGAGPTRRRRPTLHLGRRTAGANKKGRYGRARSAKVKASPAVYDLPVSSSEDSIEDF